MPQTPTPLPQTMTWHTPSTPPTSQSPPTIKNHTVTLYPLTSKLYIFGGYDGRVNHTTLMTYDTVSLVWEVVKHGVGMEGNVPPGRNGHTSTLAGDKIVIIGGWLGTGPLAASDMHVLNLSNPDRLVWSKPSVIGEPPGPCNMHSADYVSVLKEVFVFRGGNGREYLNDLHALSIPENKAETDAYTWRKVITTGTKPQPRANHSSSIIDTTLYIFGGWNGKERLNDIHLLSTLTQTWSTPNVGGTPPFPRAGMTLTSLGGRLYVFGGSGSSSKCFCDLSVFDGVGNCWIDVVVVSNNVNGDGEDDSDASQKMLKSLSSNPNSPLHTPPQTLSLTNTPPPRRAGHTSTVCGSKIYIFGGSCGPEYLCDIHYLETDPIPKIIISRIVRYRSKGVLGDVGRFFDCEDFADVTFKIENRTIFAHKIILSLSSEYFSQMFTSGFSESKSSEIEIRDCCYDHFYCVVKYLYTGVVEGFDFSHESVSLDMDMDMDCDSDSENESNENESNENEHENDDLVQTLSSTLSINATSSVSVIQNKLKKYITLLSLSDLYLLDILKQTLEKILQTAVSKDTVECLIGWSERCNAWQLFEWCRYYQRRGND